MLSERARLHRRPLCGLGAPLGTGARLFVILTAYFDESGTHAGSPATILSGIMGTANQWARFQIEMDKIKRRYGFMVFHAKEFRARSGKFSGWRPEKSAALLREMMMPSSKLMEAITVTLPTSVYDEFYRGGENHKKLRLDTKYGLCFRYALLNFVVQALKRLGTHKKFSETKLNVVMEGGHKNAGDAERVFTEMRKELHDMGCDLLHGITFAGKDDCDPIMIADYLAYGGLAMELAGANENRDLENDPPPSRKVTGMAVMKMNPEHLTALKAELVDQLKSSGRVKFILPSGRPAASSGRSS
jgi:hypothetical protein